MGILFKRSGKAILAATKVEIITVTVRNMAKSRAGKEELSGKSKGKVITPAKESAPRAPPKDKIQMWIQRIRLSISKRLGCTKRELKMTPAIHKNRNNINPLVIAIA